MDIKKLPYLIFASILLILPELLQAHENHDNEQHAFVVTGVIKNSNSATIIEDFSRYLIKRSGYPLKTVYAADYSDLSKIMRNDPYALGWTCGAPYVQDHAADQQQLIAVPTFNQHPTYYSIVLTRSKRSEKTLADFKDSVLAYSDPRSNSGFLAPKYTLFKKGIDIKTHFRLLLDAGNHEGSIEALLSGLADVAAVDEYIWLAYIKDNPEAQQALREVERMGPYPFTPIVASKGVEKKDIEKLRAALINMNNDAQGKELLKRFSLDSFVEKEDSFYAPIKLMLKNVEISTGN